MYPYNISKEPEDIKQVSSMTSSQPQIMAKAEAIRTKPDDKLIEMVNEAIESEKEKEEKYESLINQVNAREDKEILRTIKMNSVKAERLLKKIYIDIIGNRYSEAAIKSTNTNKREKEGLSEEFLECMFDCLKDVEFYRKLYFAFVNPEIRDIIYEIITDKQSDAIKFLYMETKYKA